MLQKVLSQIGVIAVLLTFSASRLDAGEVRIWEEDVTMPSYRLEAADKNPMFYKNESYQGAQRHIYPYPLLDHVTRIKEERPFHFVFLENDYIRLSILPEIGGRLFSALDKTNNHEIFYHQHVIKPALIGMLGAWISGGIEWCVFHHHRNTTHMPVDYRLQENPDGSKTIWFGETERRHRMKWLIGVTLYPDKSYIEATVKLFNPTPLPHSMLYWANVSVHVDDNFQVIFPPSVQYATYHAKNDFVHWPVSAETYRGTDYRGLDLSWWKNHPEPISFFAWNLHEDFMGGYDHGEEAGVVHVANHHIVSGAKLWEWSPGPRGRIWDKILTDSDGPYAEIMVGAYSDNQPDYSWIKPYQVRTFKQYWYPVREIGGFKKANLEAVVNLEVKNGKAEFGFNTTSQHDSVTSVLQTGDRILFQETTDIGPQKPYLRSVKLEQDLGPTDLRVALKEPLGREIISYQPIQRDYNPELPKRVEPPADPKSMKNIEEIYLAGLRVQQIYNPSIDPNVYFEEALRRDPDDTRTNTIVGTNLNRRGLYQYAESHLRRAIKRLAADYTRPGNTEAYYQLGLALRGQGRLKEATEMFYRASWEYEFQSASYCQLAEISSLRGDYSGALDHIEHSLATNISNLRARDVKVALLRKLGRIKEARSGAKEILAEDPLDFWAQNEMAWLHPAGEQRGKVLSDLRTMMRDDVQSYLELATSYGSLGFWTDAGEVLRRPVEAGMHFAATYPMLHFYLGYYLEKSGDQAGAEGQYRRATGMPSDYCFPYRMESIDVLRSALASKLGDSGNARVNYYLGNLLYEIQPEEAIRVWERSRKLDPSFGLTHRNLGWAYHYFQHDTSKAIVSYEKAIANGKHDPRVFTELDRLYEAGNVDPEKRLAMLLENHDTVVQENGSFLREIMTLVLVGQYDRAIEYLADNFFHVREGGGEIHDVFVDAHLLRGLRNLGRGENKRALADFVEAAKYPENLSVGVPRNDRRAPQVAFLTGRALEALGRSSEARQFFQKAAFQEATQHWPETRFYQALALRKLGRDQDAKNIFQNLVGVGQERISRQAGVDFFAKFGERITPQASKARGYHILGLGYLGLGKEVEAAEAFETSVQLNRSNVWAQYNARAR